MKTEVIIIYGINIVGCSLLFLLIIWPNFYFGLERRHYLLFYTVLIFLLILDIYVAIKKKKANNKSLYFISVLIPLIFWLIIFLTNFI